MREFQERRRVKKLLHSRYVIAVLILICLFLVNAVWGVYQKYEKSKAIADRMRGDLAALQVREVSLKESIDSLGTDEGKEREIRERFGAVKDGERLIVLVDDTSLPATVTFKGSKSLWQRFIGLFGF